MKLKLNLIAAAAALAFAGAAGANTQLGNTSTFGNSSAVFVAFDDAQTVSVAIDLNTTLTAFLSNNTLTSGAGALSAPGTTAVWNFAANTFTVNGVAQSGTTSWATPITSFLSSSSVANGYQWGVFAGDNVNGAKSGSNLVTGQNLLWTQASPIDFSVGGTSGVQGSALSDGSTNINNFLLAQNGKGTNTGTVKGGWVSTSGDEFLGTTLAANGVADFGTGALGNNSFLVGVNQTAYAAWASANSNTPVVRALGLEPYPSTAGTFNALNAATFTWNGAQLTYTVAAVPEADGVAMALAGLGVLGFLARRRRKA